MAGSGSDPARIIVESNLFGRKQLMDFSLESWSMLEGDSCCPAHCTGRFICDEDQWPASFSLHIQWHLITLEHITWHRIASRDMTPHKKKNITSNDMTWHNITSHDMTWHLATNHITSPHVTSQPTTLLRLTSQPTTWHHVPHHRTLHHHHHRHTTETQPATTKMPPPDGTAEGWCTQKTLFGHRTGWSPCAHSIGKFFFWFIVLFPLKLPPLARPGTICNPLHKWTTRRFILYS